MIITRRHLAGLLGAASAGALLPIGAAGAADKVVRIGVEVALTGAGADAAIRIRNAVVLAVDDANRAGNLAGYRVEPFILDDGTATAGQYDPVQAATNARKYVNDKSVVAAVGPENSGSAKALAPILNQANLAIITPAATNPDLTDPKFASLYRPSGKTTFFRTVTTDNYQGPGIANYLADVLKVKTAFVLDDSGAYGVGIADSFRNQAEKRGIQILGRDRLDPLATDYAAILTKIKSLNPRALFYGGVALAGVKLAKQAYEIIPGIIKAGGDGMHNAQVVVGAGYPAAEGWYASSASPHLADDPSVAPFVKTYTDRFAIGPSDYAITAYDGTLVILDAIRRVAGTSRPVTRDAVRDAIQNASVKTLQGTISFDTNGDLKNKVVSLYQIRRDANASLNDLQRQFQYLGAAPQV